MYPFMCVPVCMDASLPLICLSVHMAWDGTEGQWTICPPCHSGHPLYDNRHKCRTYMERDGWVQRIGICREFEAERSQEILMKRKLLYARKEHSKKLCLDKALADTRQLC